MKKQEPALLVIYGATGDLTKRKLIPALFRLYEKGTLNHPIIAVARRDLTKEEFIESLQLQKYVQSKDQKKLQSFLRLLHYFPLNFASDDYLTFKQFLKTLDKKYHTKGNKVFYLATPPTLFKPTLKRTKSLGILKGRGWNRVVFEKPFGFDLESARELNDYVKKIFKEKEIYRIDHYLGKELVQNLLIFRFTNAIFENIWNNNFVDHVQITVSEKLGVGERGGYYDKSGAVKDMVQNHLLQVLALAAMEPPKSIDADAIRDEKVKVLKALRKLKKQDIILGQYTAGTVDKQAVQGYKKETHVLKDSYTETYAALRIYIDNERWKGVPFYLRTGKRLAQRYAEVNVVLKDTDCKLFHEDKNCMPHPNIISIRIQPDEGLAIRFNVKSPGTGVKHEPVVMDFCHKCMFGLATPAAYERLMNEIFSGDQTLFTRWDFTEESWKYIKPMLKVAQRNKPFPYKSGSAGPKEGDKLLKKDKREWLSHKEVNGLIQKRWNV